MEAGVGPGTLYRHFPTREVLLSAVLDLTHAQLLECARSEKANPDCGAALDRWLEALRDQLTAFSGLAEPVLKAVKEFGSPLSLTCEALIEITDSFLKPAQEAGRVRSTVTASELFLLTLGLGWLEDKVGLYGTSVDKLKSFLRYGYLVRPPMEEEKLTGE